MAEQNRRRCPEASVSSQRSHLFLRPAGSTAAMLSSLSPSLTDGKRRREREAVGQARHPQGVRAGCGVASRGQEKSNGQEPAVVSD